MVTETINYKEKYLLLTRQYTRDVEKLHAALQDLYNSQCGMPKSCGHEFTCTCTSDKAKELIELFGD